MDGLPALPLAVRHGRACGVVSIRVGSCAIEKTWGAVRAGNLTAQAVNLDGALKINSLNLQVNFVGAKLKTVQ